MTRKSDISIERLREMRANIHALAAIQGELRSAVERRRAQDPPKTIGAISSEISVSWRDLKGLLDQERSISGGASVKKIAAYAHCPEIADKICALTDATPDRFLGAASATPEAIDCAFDLEEAWTLHAETFDQRTFANAFGDHHATVLGAIRHARAAFTTLANPAVREAIRAILADTSFMNRIASATETSAGRQLEKSKRLAALVVRLKPRYRFRQNVAKALDVCRTTLIAACNGTAGEETIDELIAKATALVHSPADAPQGVPAPAVPTPPPPAPPTQEGAGQTEGNVQPPASAIEVLEKLGGETSPLGVRFVLGPDSFREIAMEQIEAFIAFGLRQLELARIVLNFSAQIKDEATRKRIREAFGKHVEETELAIRIHTARYPNRLTKLHQGEREAWAAVGGTPKPPRKA